ncbi:unnamed protein product [Ilex paraguariensis]|uniref:Uncharacterized protein n=1 Tax=Ilex paraguariensis TaxID=185542 RepID=A0ABC8UL53_9AQUA
MDKKTDLYKFFALHPPPPSDVKPSYPTTQNTNPPAILVVTSAVAAVLPFLPCEYIDGNRVPTVIFKGLPSIFHGFIISIMFAFSGSFSELFLHNRPKMARFCRFYSVVSMASAILIVLYAMCVSI